MILDNIRIVLVETSHPGNIGSTARAMKTMGLSQLYLVSPKKFPDWKALEMAAGADDIVNQAVVTDNLTDALAGCQLILATSARPRGIGLPGLLPESAGEMVAALADDTKVAILFGREHSGLTNEELLRCHYHINIPSNPVYSSLNLAQAVQIVAYEMRMKCLKPAIETELRPDKLAEAQAVENFFKHLEQIFIKTEFLNPANPRRLMQRMRRLFGRIQLEDMEVNLLRGMLTQIDYTIAKASRSAPAEQPDADAS